MKYQIPPLASDIIITIYIVGTLLWRFIYESYYQVTPGLSIVLGLSFLLVLWALIKLKILNPNYFGFFKKKKQ